MTSPTQTHPDWTIDGIIKDEAAKQQVLTTCFMINIFGLLENGYDRSHLRFQACEGACFMSIVISFHFIVPSPCFNFN